MNNACPSCATVYTVTPTDVGRRIACAKCGTALRVGEAGLEPDKPEEKAASSEPANPSTPAKKAGRPFSADFQAWTRDIDPPTFLFSSGILVVLFFLFLPLIGAAKIERRSAQLQEATLDHAVRIRSLQEKKESEKAVKDAEEKWSKVRDEYQDSVKYAEYSKAQSLYWERYGLLLGYMLVAGGGVWLLRTEQPLAKRIVAGVVVTVQLLLAFQTITPLGCVPAARAYNRGVEAPTDSESRT